MTIKKRLVCFIFLIMAPVAILADSVRISQVDSSDLLLNQEIRLYISVTDNAGFPVKGLRRSSFAIHESPDGRSTGPVREIVKFQEGINYAEGVNFLLLIDNSESMYWTMEGDKTDDDNKRRITIAKNAVLSFLESVKVPEDQVGIVVYNSDYKVLSGVTSDMESVKQQLENIERPTGNAIYSEIYASLSLAVDELGIARGRKAVIILSDGVNNPAFSHTKKINPRFGAENIPYQEPLEKLRVEGISLYVINFGAKNDKKDRHLKTIASESGGVTFDARDQDELTQVYSEIMNQIQGEYALSYRASMDPSDLTRVWVRYLNNSDEPEGSRAYLSSSVFGVPSTPSAYASPIALLIAALLLWWLSKLRFEKPFTRPSIEVFNAGAGKVSNQILPLDNGKTVIGSSTMADLTIADLPAIEENHAAIEYDPESRKYAIKGNGKILVNNQRITTKVLEPGDFINIDGVTMIFDEGSDEE